jgi:hypothetical protein
VGEKIAMKPPLVQTISDQVIHHFTSEKLILIKPPTITPYFRVLVYQLQSKSFSVSYNTTFYKKLRKSAGFYIRFIILICEVQEQNVYFLYDISNGDFPGKLTIPQTDPCYRQMYLLGQGFTVSISCKILGELITTIYETAVHNRSGYVEYGLINGIKFRTRSMRMFRATGDDVYTMPIISGKRYICAYLKANGYRILKKLTVKSMEI